MTAGRWGSHSPPDADAVEARRARTALAGSAAAVALGVLVAWVCGAPKPVELGPLVVVGPANRHGLHVRALEAAVPGEDRGPAWIYPAAAALPPGGPAAGPPGAEGLSAPSGWHTLPAARLLWQGGGFTVLLR